MTVTHIHTREAEYDAPALSLPDPTPKPPRLFKSGVHGHWTCYGPINAHLEKVFNEANRGTLEDSLSMLRIQRANFAISETNFYANQFEQERLTKAGVQANDLALAKLTLAMWLSELEHIDAKRETVRREG